MSDKDEFYIGWMPSAPDKLSIYIRRIVILLLFLLMLGGAIIALHQQRFSTASFEFGQLTEVKGIYQRYPVPSVKLRTRKDISGNESYLTIPLVGYGKFGAEGVIASIEKENAISLDQKEVVLKGVLLYSDGKSLLQLDQHDKPLISVKSTSDTRLPSRKELGVITLKGEILDPKCYFGVMKPGRGKPHRDCAIRCIAGGMSPVFRIRNEKGEANYCLIVGSNGEKINEQLVDYIAEPVALEARAVEFDDWIVLYLDGPGKIKRLGGYSWFKLQDGTISCGPGH